MTRQPCQASRRLQNGVHLRGGCAAESSSGASSDAGSSGGGDSDTGSSGGGDSDLIGNIRIPLFCMGDASFDEAALTKNGFTSVALNIFEPRYCEMAKQILADGGEKMFGYMERAPPVDENGEPNFVGESGILAKVVWHRWLEKQGPGGRVAIDIVPGPRFTVLAQTPGGPPLGVEDAPPLVHGEVELVEDDDEFGDLVAEELIDVLGEGLDATPDDPEYIPAQASATTDSVQVRIRSGFQGRDRGSQQMVVSAHLLLCLFVTVGIKYTNSSCFRQWAYEVTIANLGEAPIKVLTRHWIITDGPSGEITEVGPGAHGILGEQPTIEPGRAVRYTSSTPLKSEYGSMEGSFEIAVLAQTSEEACDATEETAEAIEETLIQARIPRVALSIDGKPVKMVVELGA
eukprot:COSAG05_NODE_1478_length_4772_cov_14.903921_1_plen_402_part_00